ncbi:unnamed protein product [Heligmosomoides polygyrus]|uniref:Nuclear pore complex protein Nup85 n=1 Tax=Heligmosomoides polygyrus TaxID=6339 RepID=A0A183GT16_HELPZ|nr:unnamed protein product [Heligmosomoides polygyrus]
MLLKYIRSEPLAKKYFPLQTHSENLTSWDLPRTLPASHYSWIPVCFRMSAWLYSEYPGDRKMCDVIEEIFSLTEQIHPIFLIDVVKFLLNEIWTGIYKESWPAIVRFMVGVCRRLEEAGIDSAFGYLAMLWDGWSADDFLNESEVPKGLITQAEELLASCEYEKLKIYVDCFLKWKHEGCQNASIADVFNSADRADRIAVCSQRLAEERVQSPHQGSSEGEIWKSLSVVLHTPGGSFDVFFMLLELFEMAEGLEALH